MFKIVIFYYAPQVLNFIPRVFQNWLGEEEEEGQGEGEEEYLKGVVNSSKMARYFLKPIMLGGS